MTLKSNAELELVYLKDRTSWRSWLKNHHKNKTEIWFMFPKKASGMPGISYNDAVEEALCFGWIDSTARSYDEDFSIQRFTPRRKNSSYSQPNKERLKWLDSQNMIEPSIREAIKEIIEKEFVFPKDILQAIKKNKTAWENYERFSAGYRRLRVAYIDSARDRPEEFDKRLQHFIRKTADNKMIRGHGGVDKYYK
ncbi:MAG: YdeI/OmpD-associated family protein [Bacteroidales bacterium]|nr:YdeI/OmpD-associated family protein [Bacteroidales bacterium]